MIADKHDLTAHEESMAYQQAIYQCATHTKAAGLLRLGALGMDAFALGTTGVLYSIDIRILGGDT